MVRGFKNLILIVIIAAGMGICAAQESTVTGGIEEYKNGNYEACIITMKNVVKKDPTDVVGYYYLGLAYTKIGKEILAVENYNKVINLNSDSSLTALAKQGKDKIGKKKATSIEEQIEDIEEEYNPIMNDGVVEERAIRTETETKPEQKTEPKTTRVIKASDYAGGGVNNNQTSNQNKYDPNREPTNDDIVNAIRTLQKAGLLQNGAMGLPGMNNNLPLDSRTQQMNSMLMMMNNGNNNNNMMQMMPYMNNGGKVDPQMMQMMLMQQMMPNFGGNNNNNNGY